MSRKITNEIFVQELAALHPNLIPLTQYNGDKESVVVRCVKHNYDFTTKPNTLKHGSGCKFCGRERSSDRRRKSVRKLLEELNAVHNSKYEYPHIKEEYRNNKSEITIVCPIHGEFKQKTIKHLQGEGCKLCSHQSFPYTTKTYIQRANEVHHNRYNYDKTTYIDRYTDIVITCPTHGDFIQNPKVHLGGCGCQKCKESIFEREIRNILDKNHILYAYEDKTHTLSNKSVDFYLNDYNIAIECQGEQHFIPVDFFGGEKKLETYIYRDILKNDELFANNIKIIYVISKKFADIFQDPKFNGIYENNVLFIEDIIENPLILVKTLEKRK